MWRKVLCVCCFILAVLNIAVIFRLSGESAEVSNSRSLSMAETFVKSTGPSDQQVTSSIVQFFNHYVRKIAHFGEYATLGFLCCMGFLLTWFKLGFKPFFAGLICLITAMSDELYQATVPGRAAMVTDVITDMGGSLTGILFSCLLAAAVSHLVRQRRLKMPKKAGRRTGYRAAPKDNLPPV